MPKYRIAWLPGDGVGVDVLEAARPAQKRPLEFSPKKFQRLLRESRVREDGYSATKSIRRPGIDRIYTTADSDSEFQEFIQERKHL